MIGHIYETMFYDKKTRGTTRLLEDEDLSLYSLELNFATTSILYSHGFGDVTATFDLMVRDRPPHRNFLMAGGLESIIDFIRNITFSEDQIAHLLEQGRISKEFGQYLENFSFTGSLYAMPEGTVHFPGEPMIRITAPLIEANLLPDQLISLATVDTLYLSKLARLRIAAKDVKIAVGHIRGHGLDAGWRLGRCSQLFEDVNFSNPAFAMRLGQGSSPIIVGNHAFITSFPTELDAMRAITDSIQMSSPMVDTYETKQGIKNAIIVADELKAKNKKLFAITIDSGNILTLARHARKELNKAGHTETLIVITGNLDEYKIAYLLKNRIPADAFLAVTEVITSSDSPKLEVVYKLAQVVRNNKITYKSKLAPGKQSFPGEKQVFRSIKNGKIVCDQIGLTSEQLGEALLTPIFINGKLVYRVPNLNTMKSYVKQQLSLIPDKYLSLETDFEPPTKVSRKLKKLVEKVKEEQRSLNSLKLNYL